MEGEVDRSQRLGLQLEALKKDKARLVSQLTAQESVIDGLRAERKVWGQELAQQGDRARRTCEMSALKCRRDSERQINCLLGVCL